VTGKLTIMRLVLALSVVTGCANCTKTSPAIALPPIGSQQEEHKLRVGALGSDLVLLEKLLTRNPALVNRRMRVSQSTALMIAAEADQSEAVRFLVSAGADLQMTDKYGMAPLHYAAKADAIGAVRELVRLGADMNQEVQSAATGSRRCSVILTPLDFAARRGAEATVNVLLDAGATVAGGSIPTSRSAIHFAVSGGYRNHDEDLRRNRRGSVSDGNAEVIELLLAHGAQLSEPDCNGDLPIHICTQNLASETLSYLLKYHAAEIDVNAVDALGRTPLHRAVAAMTGPTPAEMKRFEQVVRMLIAYGADVSRTTNKWPSTSYENAREDHVDVPEHLRTLLLPRSTDPAPSPIDEQGRFALAARDGDAMLMESLLQRSPWLATGGSEPGQSSQLYGSASSGDVLAVRLLVKHGADVNSRDPLFGYTATHGAASRNQVDVLKVLLELGADPDIRTHESAPFPQQTALGVAARSGAVETVEFLLKHGVSLSGNPPEYYLHRVRQPRRPPSGGRAT
jgi:ankyrin repeat protein